MVLTYLPHMQKTVQQKDDYWEVVAIKLNSYRFETEEKHVYIHGRKQSPSDQPAKMPLAELPTFSGPFVKNMYEEIMEKFKDKVYYANRDSSITSLELSGPDKTWYRTPSIPVRGAYSTRCDRILCELCYLEGYDVVLLAELSKERFEKNQRREFEEMMKEIDDNQADSNGNDSHAMVDKAKLMLDRNKIEQYEQDLAKKIERIEFLDKQNKKLLELNHALVSQQGEAVGESHGTPDIRRERRLRER